MLFLFSTRKCTDEKYYSELWANFWRLTLIIVKDVFFFIEYVESFFLQSLLFIIIGVVFVDF